MFRPQPAETATALWAALRKVGEDGLTAKEAELAKIASEAYARRRFRLWANAGYLANEKGVQRVSGNRYRMLAGAPKRPPAITTTGQVILTHVMPKSEFARIRRKIGATESGMAELIGWTGSKQNMARLVRRIESGARPIDEDLAAKVRALWRATERAKYEVGEMPDWGAMRYAVKTNDPRELRFDEEDRLFDALREDAQPMGQKPRKSAG